MLLVVRQQVMARDEVARGTHNYLHTAVDAPQLGAELAANPAYDPAPGPHALGEPPVRSFVGIEQPAVGWGCGDFVQGTAMDEGFAAVDPVAAPREVRSGGYRFSSRLLGNLDQAVTDPGMPGRAENYVDYPVEAYQDA
jgi:hypothetical protein